MSSCSLCITIVGAASGGYCFGIHSKWRCRRIIRSRPGRRSTSNNCSPRNCCSSPRGIVCAHALAACRLAERRQLEPVEATSLHTLVQMVDNGLGITLLPQLAIDGGILSGTTLTVLPTTGEQPSREIGLVWRRGTGRQRESELLASVLTRLVEERPRP